MQSQGGIGFGFGFGFGLSGKGDGGGRAGGRAEKKSGAAAWVPLLKTGSAKVKLGPVKEHL